MIHCWAPAGADEPRAFTDSMPQPIPQPHDDRRAVRGRARASRGVAVPRPAGLAGTGSGTRLTARRSQLASPLSLATAAAPLALRRACRLRGRPARLAPEPLARPGSVSPRLDSPQRVDEVGVTVKRGLQADLPMWCV